MVRDHDMGESSMVRDHDMGESSMVRDDQVDNQIVVLPEHLQHHDDSDEFQHTPNGTSYWVPDVPEDEKPKKGLFFGSYNDAYETYLVYSQKARSKEVNTLNEVDGEDGENSASKKRKRHSPTRAHRLKAALVGGYDKMLEAFLKMHKKQPPFAVTDQDAALRNVVLKTFPDSHHRLCMWHITKKLPGKKQRYTQRVLDNASNESTPTRLTELPFEKHACDVYTPSIFRENVLPAHFLDKRHRYGLCIEETDTLASQVHQTIEECIGLFRNDTNKLSELLSTVQGLKKKLENEFQTPHVELNKDSLYSDLLDVTVLIRKVPFKRRTCSSCGGKGHNKATCERCTACGEPGHHKGICKKFPNQDKGGVSGKNVLVDDEDKGDTDDQFDDEALGATEDEVDEDDDVDEEYESDEE
ncbi:FAR1 DNA binding domain-containing protein [Tanacetum coccineum]